MGHWLVLSDYLRDVRDGVLIFMKLLRDKEQFQMVLAYYPELKAVIPPEVIEMSLPRVWLRDFYLGLLMVVNLGYIIWVVKRLF